MDPTSERSGRVSAASAQGSRPSQEDRTLQAWIDLPGVPGNRGWLLAVFDGHRGADVAEKARRALPALFAAALQAFPGNLPEALRETFRSLNQQSLHDRSGSTASVVFISEDGHQATLAVLGDSPIAVLDDKNRVHVGPEHNVRTNIRERAAAEARGGVYQDGYLEDSDHPGTGLQMARALGDSDLGRVLCREPEIETVPLGRRAVVLVGSDGLFSAGGGPAREQLERLFRLIARGTGAEGLVEDAVKHQTADNVSVVVWKKD